LVVDLVDRAGAINPLQQAAICIVVQHGWKLAHESGNSASQGGWPVIQTSCDSSALQRTPYELLARHVQIDGASHSSRVMLEPPVQRQSLSERTRKAFQDHATGGVWLAETFEHKVGDLAVRAQITSPHHVIRCIGKAVAQKVPARDMGDTQRRAQERGLRSFASARPTEEEHHLRVGS
jgi:hypothetical protein